MTRTSKVDREPGFTPTENLAVFMLARHFAGSGNYVFPNVMLGGGEMDLAVVTRSGYLWEIEVKLTLADWKRDAHKSKWGRDRDVVSRFFYAVPTKIIDQEPEFVPEGTGLLELLDSGYIRERRTARRRSSPKVNDQQRLRLFRSTHHRFWTERMHRHRQQKHAMRLREMNRDQDD